MTLKKQKKTREKISGHTKKISSNQNPTNLKCPMSRSAHFTMHDAHYFVQLAKDFKPKSKTMHCAAL